MQRENILDQLVQATKTRIARDKATISPEEITGQAKAIAQREVRAFTQGTSDQTVAASAETRTDQGQTQAKPETEIAKTPQIPLAFETALKAPAISFICEVKKASPSKGVIAEDFPYLQIAKEYEGAGATCLSVLTEPDYFLGSDTYLSDIRKAVNIPVLRKDFTVDPYQIYQAKVLGAHAVLLICAILTPAELKSYLEIAKSLNLSALVETHDEREVKIAVQSGARIIGVNNRDLKTFAVDLQNSLRLRKLVPQDILFVSESGIQTPAHVQLLRENHIDAVLIGETLMRRPDKKAALAQLRGIDKGGTP